MKLNSYIIIGVILVVLTGAAAARYFIHTPVPPPEHIFIYDQSTSKINGCTCLTQEARKLVNNVKLNKEIISLYALGTPESGYKPKPIASYEIPKNDSVYKDRTKEKEQIENLIADLENKCKAIPRTDTTPLFQAVNTAVEQLKRKCSPQSRCSIFVQTDLEESIEPQVLDAFKTVKGGKEPLNLKSIDNTGIFITFAGVSELVVSPKKPTNGKDKNKDKSLDKMKDAEIWQKLWTRILTHNDSIDFRPICSLLQ
jgi:hypothetical protein